MPCIPRHVKPPPRVPITCRLPEETAILIKQYAEFLDSTQEYVIDETVRLVCRRDKEFHAWLTTTHPETRITERGARPRPADPPRQTPAKAAARDDPRGERTRS